MKKLNFLIILFVLLSGLSVVKTAHADVVIDNGLNFLRSKQDATGRINTGFSAPSQWSAIAFAANGIDISTVKNPSVSLQDFLISNVPSEQSAATDWANQILAIVATNGDSTNYNGVNYVNHLESFYNNNQIGYLTSLNDDIFGLLALIASGNNANPQIEQNTLNFITTHQASDSGGFSWSPDTTCQYCDPTPSMTAAAIQALQEAKSHNISNPNLEDSLSKAQAYIANHQNGDGGFGDYGPSDTDTTGWVLMAFNVLNMQNSTQAVSARKWLISQQSNVDGGITAFDYGSNKFISNASTTAQAVIGLAGKSWILKIFDPSSAITPSPIAQTPTPTPTPTDNSSSSTSVTPTPTATPVPTATPTVLAQADNSSPNNVQPTSEAQITPTPEEVAKAPIVLSSNANKNTNNPIFVILFTGFGLFFTFTYLIRMFIIGERK